MFKLFREKPHQHAANSIYAAIVAQARRPQFYADLGVPDTLDGRFDLLVMHAFLFFYRLKGEADSAPKCAQLVFDAMFADLDQNLREMGVGDMSIGKKVRKMGSAFYGRTKAYDGGLQSFESDPELLADAVRRNVFSEGETGNAASLLAAYMADCVEALRRQSVDDILDGRLVFPEAAFEERRKRHS
jgi:cytochrome b pre-mRNA-processing protein 3